MADTNNCVIQPSFIFDLIGVKNNEDSNKILSAVLSMLYYLPRGSRIESASLSLERISDDLLYISGLDNFSDAIEILASKNVLKIPV
jgi:hypothetical protein